MVTSAKIFSCPSDSAGTIQLGYPLTNTVGQMAISYAYSAGLIWQDIPDSIIALDRMGRDAANGAASMGSVYAKSTAYTRNYKWLGNGTTPLAPHKDAGGNVLYNDGHVTWQNSLPTTAGASNDPIHSVLVPD